MLHHAIKLTVPNRIGKTGQNRALSPIDSAIGFVAKKKLLLIAFTGKTTAGTRMILPLRLLTVFTAFLLCVSCFAGDRSPAAINNWRVVESAFRPVNLTAQG